MACPYFVPREIVYDIAWPHPARLPLGAGWSGGCCASDSNADADASTPIAVDNDSLRDFCNLGYASACPHIPPARDWDAVRFSVAGSAAQQITLFYVCEKNHAPIAHGTMTYDLARKAWRDPHADARVHRLANSYLQAYRVRQSGSLI
ncbi:MAG: hypothetical protein WB817_07355 [Terriglobales bacterium]